MAIIYSYQENEELRNSDMLVGTATTLHNGQVRKITKNFTLGQLKTFISTGGLILSNGGTSGPATLIDNVLNIPVYQGAITLTTTGSTGSATLIGNTLNIPVYSGGVVYTFNAPLTEASGTVSISQANTTTNGYLSSTDWNTFNGKQDTITLTTIGTSGVATLIGDVLNIPNYSAAAVTPTLDEVLTEGNTSLQNAYVGEIGLWDPTNTAYAKISSDDNILFIKDAAANSLFSINQGSFAVNKNNSISAKISTVNLTSSRTFYFPDATGTIALLTSLSSAATGLTYTNTTGVFSLTSGYSIPTTSSQTDWDTAYTNRITSLTTTGTGAATLIANVLNIPTPPTATFTSLTTTGSSGSSTLTAGVLNVPTYTLSGLGGVPTSRTLTINGTAYDLTADRSWSVGTVTSVTATSPITSTGGTTPVISTSMATNKLIGRSTAGTGVMEEITIGSGLALSGGTLSSSALSGSILHGIAAGTDTYTVTITGATAYADGDAYLINFTNGNTTSATLNINGQGAIALWRNNDGPLIGGDIVSGGEILCVYRVANNVFQCIGTAPNTLLAYVTNAETTTITKGQAVYVSGGTGDRIKVKLAYNTSDATSAQTIGIVQSTSIAANQKGLIIVQGQLDGLSLFPTASWADGDFIYLGATPGTLTNVKPFAPNHLVYLGYVTTASNGSAGRMYVKVQNGYEMDELHDVYINPTTLANGDLLQYNSATDLWLNKSLSAAGIQPTLPTLTSGSVIFSNGTTLAQDNANFFWDDTNNRLGLGTAVPSWPLSLGNTFGNKIALYDQGSGTGIGFGVQSNLLQVFSTGDISFGSGYSTAFTKFVTIKSSGDMGIGTATPTTKLDVNGVIRGILSDPSGLGGITAKLLSYSPSPYGLVFRGYSSGAHSIQSQREANDAQMYPLILQPNGSNVGIGTITPTAKLDVNGDALINGVTVGRGQGNDASNTVIGRDAFVNNLSGQQNTVIGYSAGANLTSGGSNVFVGQSAGINVNSGVGNTIIGTLNSFSPTGAPADFSDTLSISKGESNYGTFLPHIWAPAVMSTSSTATIISAAAGSYRAMFVEYVIEDEEGNIRGGYIKGIWNNDLSVIKITEDTTSSIGVTSNYVFDIVDDGSSNAALQITSLSTEIVYCSVTSRLLTRPY